jgi:hypothetical protein
MHRSLILPALALLTAASAFGAPPDAWRVGLLAQGPGAEIRIRLDDGFTLEGFLVDVTADSVLVAEAPGGPRIGACALEAVAAVEHRGRSTARGWQVGSVVGGVAGGAYGLLMAALIDDITGSSEPLTATDHAALTVAGASAGAAACGLVGAAVSSGTHRWYRLEPWSAGRHRGPGFGLHAGLATAGSLDADLKDGLHLGLDLAWRRGRFLELATEATWSNTGRTVGMGTGPVVEVGATGSLGLAARLGLPAPGLAPFVSLGAGWYRRDDSWLGASVGFGVRFRVGRENEIPLHLRWHWRAGGLDAEPTNSQVTVTAGWVMPMSFR